MSKDSSGSKKIIRPGVNLSKEFVKEYISKYDDDGLPEISRLIKAVTDKNEKLMKLGFENALFNTEYLILLGYMIGTKLSQNIIMILIRKIWGENRFQRAQIVDKVKCRYDIIDNMIKEKMISEVFIDKMLECPDIRIIALVDENMDVPDTIMKILLINSVANGNADIVKYISENRPGLKLKEEFIDRWSKKHPDLKDYLDVYRSGGTYQPKIVQDLMSIKNEKEKERIKDLVDKAMKLDYHDTMQLCKNNDKLSDYICENNNFWDEKLRKSNKTIEDMVRDGELRLVQAYNRKNGLSKNLIYHLENNLKQMVPLFINKWGDTDPIYMKLIENGKYDVINYIIDTYPGEIDNFLVMADKYRYPMDISNLLIYPRIKSRLSKSIEDGKDIDIPINILYSNLELFEIADKEGYIDRYEEESKYYYITIAGSMMENIYHAVSSFPEVLRMLNDGYVFDQKKVHDTINININTHVSDFIMGSLASLIDSYEDNDKFRNRISKKYINSYGIGVFFKINPRPVHEDFFSYCKSNMYYSLIKKFSKYAPEGLFDKNDIYDIDYGYETGVPKLEAMLSTMNPTNMVNYIISGENKRYISEMLEIPDYKTLDKKLLIKILDYLYKNDMESLMEQVLLQEVTLTPSEVKKYGKEWEIRYTVRSYARNRPVERITAYIKNNKDILDETTLSILRRSRYSKEYANMIKSKGRI